MWRAGAFFVCARVVRSTPRLFADPVSTGGPCPGPRWHLRPLLSLACRLKGLTPEDMLVYQCIQGAGNMGEACVVQAGPGAVLSRLTLHLQLDGLQARTAHKSCQSSLFPRFAFLVFCRLPAGIWTRDMKARTNLQQVRGQHALVDVCLQASPPCLVLVSMLAMREVAWPPECALPCLRCCSPRSTRS